jgi:endo-1,4-beta-xylanase
VSPTPVPVVTAAGDGRVAALTLDDGPDAEATPAVLDLLREHRVRATFCVVGDQVTAPGGAEVLRRTVAEGHHLAAHGMTYADMGEWAPQRVRAALEATVAVIREALGDPAAPVPWFRAPNGSWGRSATVAAGLGLQPLGVTGTIDDWRTQDVPTLVANLHAVIRAAPSCSRTTAAVTDGERCRRWRPCCRSGWMPAGASPARPTPTSARRTRSCRREKAPDRG